jgi:GT2 family glycosyltransferase
MAMDRGYDFALIVNADTEVANPEFVDALVDAASRNPRAAFLGPLVYYRTKDRVQNTCLKFPGIFRNTLVWLPWRLWPGLISKQTFTEREVEFLNGVCVLCRIDALREIGLMDEAYGGYQEDTDWSWRARQMGWTSVFTPVPGIIHHEESDGYEFFSLKSFLLKRNTVFWLLKVGRRTSATLYAYASMALAHLRSISARTDTERRKHRYFLERLRRSYKGLLDGEELGSWYGPPLGSWDWGNPDGS